MKPTVIAVVFGFVLSSVAGAQDYTYCPGPKNSVINCHGTNCSGQVEVGGCGGTASGTKCQSYSTPCCGKNYSFGEDNGILCGSSAACAQPQTPAVGGWLVLPVKGQPGIAVALLLPARDKSAKGGPPTQGGQAARTPGSGGRL